MKITIRHGTLWCRHIEYLPSEHKTIRKGDKVQVKVLIGNRTFQKVMKGDMSSLKEYVMRSIFAYEKGLGL
jgi:hypothetical protein